MLPALHLRLRASCLTWHPLEFRWLAQPQRHASTAGRRPPPSGPRQPRLDPKVETDETNNNRKLLEELFPEEAARRSETEKSKREREVPRLQFNVPAPTPSPARLRQKDDLFDVGNQKDRKTYAHLRNQERLGDGQIGVLVLRNASKNLTDDDFRRLIPQGKHIEGWNLERGDILKIVPGRNTSTLERENFYFILFNSPRSAFVYQTQVTRLHRLAQSQMPTSMMSPVPAPPPPASSMNGDDLYTLLQTYALVPPHQNIQMRLLQRPYVPSVEQIVRNRGYPAIVSRRDRSPVEVALRLEGLQLAIPHIKSALYYAARQRGLPWTGHDRATDFFKWEPPRTIVSPMGPRRLTEGENVEDAEKNLEDAEENAEDETHSRGRKPMPCYIVGFDTEAEAQTFVRYWHRRPMELRDFIYHDNDIAPIVNAEILW